MNIKEYIPFLVTFGILVVLTLFVNNGSLTFWDGEVSTIVKDGNSIYSPIQQFLWSLGEVTEWQSRLWSGVSVLLTLLAMFVLGRKTLGGELAMVSMVVLGSTFGVLVAGKLAFPYALGLLFATVSVLSYLNYWNTKNKFWLLGIALGLLLGTLVSGVSMPILLVGMGLVMGVYKKELDVAFWLTTILTSGGALYFLASNQVYLFAYFDAPYSYQFPHIMAIILAFVPWFAFVFPSFLSFGQQLRKKMPLAIFILGWLVFGWLLYEFSPIQSFGVVLLAYPAFAILIAQQLISYIRPNYTMNNFVKGMSIIQMVVLLFLSIYLMLLGWQLFEGDGLRRGIGVSLFLTGTSIGMMVGVLLKSERMILWSGALCGLMFILLTWTRIIPAFEPQRAFFNTLDSDKTVYYHLSETNKTPSFKYYLNGNYKEITTVEAIDSSVLKKENIVILDDVTFEQYKTMNNATVKADSTRSLFLNNRKGGYYIRVK